MDMPLVQREDHPLYPANAPEHQPHILQDAEYKENTRGHRLCDFIATVLYRLEQYPDALKDFFDPNVKTFKLLRIAEGDFLLPLMIWRKGNVVMAGFYQIIDNERRMGWECLSRSKLSKVASDGVWTAKWGAQMASSRLLMDTIWKPYGLGSVNHHPSHHLFRGDPADALEAKEVACAFGHAIYVNKIWKQGDGVEFVVEVEKMNEAEKARNAEKAKKAEKAKVEKAQKVEKVKAEKEKAKAQKAKAKAEKAKQAMNMRKLKTAKKLEKLGS